MFGNKFKTKVAKATTPDSDLEIKYESEGLVFAIKNQGIPYKLNELFQTASSLQENDRSITIYLAQLVEEDLAELKKESIIVSWTSIFKITETPDHRDLLPLLNLPPIKQVAPLLNAKGALSDKEFNLFIEGWILNGVALQNVKNVGAFLEWDSGCALLPNTTWLLISSMDSFALRSDTHKNQSNNELAWGQIRALAEQSGAIYSSKYLQNTVVITPATLRLPMEMVEIFGERVIQVKPTFEGAPDGWLQKFDEYTTVQSHYDFLRNGGRYRVILTDQVQKVFKVIKKEMPGRRIAGAKAEAFMRNPFAILGEGSHEVIDETAFEKDKADAGFFSSTFRLLSVINKGRIQKVSLEITSYFPDGKSDIANIPFEGVSDLDKFLSKLSFSLDHEFQFIHWADSDLDVDGDSERQLAEGKILLHTWNHQPQASIQFEDVCTLENYSNRIEGIGVATPIYIPVISRASEGTPGWDPDVKKIDIAVNIPGHSGQVIIPLEKKWINQFEQKVASAEKNGTETVIDDKLPAPLKILDARRLVNSFNSIYHAAEKVEKSNKTTPDKLKQTKVTLLVKHNLGEVNYEEQRRQMLTTPELAVPIIPNSIRTNVQLLPHQKSGVAWLQHLLKCAPDICRGALLADDMGLGKTLQLLTLLGSLYDKRPEAFPCLIVAPVSLLDNWLQEADKFFDESFPKILCLYGENLHKLKQPPEYIDARLIQEKGITSLLKPDWLGNSKIVLTTYETLRDYEFSLARQDFTVMICDEAQKVKTPNAMVTLAAKKQKVIFRVACTGTPVENTLADLWCLFDFIQPGLLGALDHFSRIYRRPIEAKSDEQKKAVERLRLIIEPQLLRRTKKLIKEHLPEKIFVKNNAATNRLEIAISSYQRQLYIDGLKKLRNANNDDDHRTRCKASFEILHFIKAVCAEPYCLPRMRFQIDTKGIPIHLENSPKIAWLIQILTEVKTKGEKAILFTELREVQNALCQFLSVAFKLRPFVINGTTKARQQLIDEFQKKDGFDVLILSPLAAGVGLNIVKANHVIHFTRTWNPAKEAQATDRAYRIGATKDVFVYCPTIVAPDFTTFEAKLDDLMNKKRDVADDMLNGAGEDINYTEFGSEGPNGESSKDRPITINDVDRMDGIGFEVFCKLLWGKLHGIGYVTDKNGGDGGIDVVVISESKGYLIQCKVSLLHDQCLGWDAIKEVVGGFAKYQNRHPGVSFEKVAATNKRFNENAISQATVNNVKIVQRKDIEQMIEKSPVMRSEFDNELFRTNV